MMKRFFNYLQKRFNVVIFWGLPDNDGPVGEITAHGVEKVFMQGCSAAMGDRRGECPYPEHSLHRHWYTRGFAYMARFKRALEAEELLKVERLRADRLEANFKSLSRQYDEREQEMSDQIMAVENARVMAERNGEIVKDSARQLVWDLVHYCEPPEVDFENERNAWARAKEFIEPLRAAAERGRYARG